MFTFRSNINEDIVDYEEGSEYENNLYASGRSYIESYLYRDSTPVLQTFTRQVKFTYNK